eukprot:tig00021098_g18189.t1
MTAAVSAKAVRKKIVRQCGDAAAAGQRGHCIFDPALLAADGAAAAFAINPPRPASSQFSARVFVNTDPAKPASYAPADVFYVPPGSPLCGKEVFRERVEPGFYIEAQPGRRFAVVAEEHFGPQEGSSGRYHVQLSPLRRHGTVFAAGQRTTLLGDWDGSAVECKPFVFKSLEAEAGSSSSSSNSASSAAPAAEPGSFELVFSEAVWSEQLAAARRRGRLKVPGKRDRGAGDPPALQRKRAKCLGGVAAVDYSGSLVDQYRPTEYDAGGRLCTLTVRYRSRLWMMVAGLRPDLLPGAAAADEAPAVVGNSSAASSSARGSSSSGGGGSSAAGSSSGSNEEDLHVAHPPPIDVDALPDSIDLTAEDDELEAGGAAAGLPGRFHRPGAPAVDVALDAAACATAEALLAAAAAHPRVGPPPAGHRLLVSLLCGEDGKVEVRAGLGPETFRRWRDKATEVLILLAPAGLQCRNAAVAGQRGHCIFDPALLEADEAAATFAINPPRPASSQFSARVFVNTDPAKPVSYAPVDVFCVPSGSPLCGKEVFRERVEPGFYIEAQPGRRFAVVAEEHFGPQEGSDHDYKGSSDANVFDFESEAEREDRRKNNANAYSVKIQPLRRLGRTIKAGQRTIILGELDDSGEGYNPFVFRSLDADLAASSASASAPAAAAAAAGSFDVIFSKAEWKRAGGCSRADRELLRKRAKSLGGVAAVDPEESLASLTSKGPATSQFKAGGRLCTLTVRYRSRLWMMVAGLRPDLVPGAAAAEDPEAPASASSSSAPIAIASPIGSAKSSSSSSSSSGASPSGRGASASGPSRGGGCGSSSSSSGRDRGGSCSGVGSSHERARGAGAAASKSFCFEEDDVLVVPPPPIDLDALPDPIDLTAEEDDLGAAAGAAAGLPGRFHRPGAPAVDVALDAAACASAEALLAAAAAHPRVGPPPAGHRLLVSLLCGEDGKVEVRAGLGPETFRRWRDKATEVLILLAPAGLQCRNAAVAGQRGHCIFDPALLEADEAAATFAINPPRPASSQFSARVFVNTDPAKPVSYAPVDVFCVPSGSPLCGKEVFRERVEPGFYIEAQPGRRFAVVAEEHFGPQEGSDHDYKGSSDANVFDFESEAEREDRRKNNANAYSVKIQPLRRLGRTIKAGQRTIILGELDDSGEGYNPFVFRSLDADLAASSASASAPAAAAAAAGSFDVIFSKAEWKRGQHQQRGRKRRAKEQQEQAAAAGADRELLRKRAKSLGGVAAVDPEESLASLTSKGPATSQFKAGGRLCTLTVRYRSRLWMMVAGLRPDLVPGVAAAEDPEAPASASSSSAPIAIASPIGSAKSSSSSSSSSGASPSGRGASASGPSRGGGCGSSSSSSGRDRGGSCSGVGSSHERARGAGAAASKSFCFEEDDVLVVPPPPIDLDALPDPIDLTAEEDDLGAAAGAAAGLPGRFLRPGAPAVDVALDAAACASAEALLAAAAAHPRVGPPPAGHRLLVEVRAGLGLETFRRWRDRATEVLILLAPAGL